MKHLLVGGGLAGSSAAAAIRARDPKGSVLLIGQEVNRPYHRPPLSKGYLRRENARADIWTHPVGWFEQHDVELRTGRRVSHLDCPRRAVILSSGEEISYDNLLLATGASAKPLNIPGADLPNVFYLRTIDDAERLFHAVEKARNEGRKHPRGRGIAAIIGSGVLGVELAASLTMMGLQAHLVTTKHPWEKFAGESTGRFLTRYLEQRNVVVHAGHRPQRLDGDGRVQRVIFESQTIECDFAIAAIGIVLNRELLRGTPIAAERAILTDDHCRTNVEPIYAAGDCAAVFDPLFGKHRLIDHWDNARVTGEIAGANMAGDDRRYDVVNYVFSDVFDLSMKGWGEPRLVHHRITRGAPSPESPHLTEIGIAADGRIAQVISINSLDAESALRDLVRLRVRVDGKEEALKDPSRPLDEFVG